MMLGGAGAGRWFRPPPSLLERQDGSEPSPLAPPPGLFGWMMQASVRRAVLAPVIIANIPMATVMSDASAMLPTAVDAYERGDRCERKVLPMSR